MAEYKSIYMLPAWVYSAPTPSSSLNSKRLFGRQPWCPLGDENKWKDYRIICGHEKRPVSIFVFTHSNKPYTSITKTTQIIFPKLGRTGPHRGPCLLWNHNISQLQHMVSFRLVYTQDRIRILNVGVGIDMSPGWNNLQNWAFESKITCSVNSR